MRIRSRHSARLLRRSALQAPVSTWPLVPNLRRRSRFSLHGARRVSMCALAMGSIVCAGALLTGPVIAAPITESDENGPLVSIIRPGYNDVLKGKYRILIAVTAKKYNPQSVEMFVDDKSATGGPVPLSSLASSSFDFDTRGFSDGKHKLTVRVTDAQGFRGWSEVSFFVNNGQVVDTTPPDLRWVGIEPFQQLSGQVKLEVDADDTFGVKLLQIQINPIETPNRTPALYSWLLNQPPYRVNLDTVGKKMPDGLYSLKALAFDSNDQQGDAPPLTVGIVNNEISATTVAEMLKGRREMADVLATGKGASAPAPLAQTPRPANSRPATPATEPKQSATAPVAPQSDLTPGASLHPAAPLAAPRVVPSVAPPANVPATPAPSLPAVPATVPPRIGTPAVALPQQIEKPATEPLLTEDIAVAPTTATPRNAEVEAPQSSETPASDALTLTVPNEFAPTETMPATPASESPAVESPAVESPAVEAPAVEAPAVEAPIGDAPTSETPAVEAANVETPVVADNSAVETPALSAQTGEAVAQTPDAESSVAAPSVATTPAVSAPPANPARIAGMPRRPLSQRLPNEPGLSRFESFEPRIAPTASASRAYAPQGARAMDVARLSLPGLSGRRVSGAPVLSQKVGGDGSQVSRIEAPKRVRLSAAAPLATASPALSGIARAVRVSAPSMTARALYQHSKLVREAQPKAVAPRVSRANPSKAVATKARPRPIEIAPVASVGSVTNSASAQSAPRMSAPTAPRIGGNAEAPSKFSKAVPSQGQAPRVAALPRPDAANRSGAAISIVPTPEPLQVAAMDVPASYVTPRTMSLRAVAAQFGLPVELVALSNDWNIDMKLLKGMTVRLPRPLQVSYNGVPIKGDAPSMLIGGTGVTAFRFLFEQSGGKLQWDAANQRVVARKDGKEIVLNIGSNIAKVGDKEVAMELAAFLFEGRTMVPVRFFEEGLNAQVEWNPQTGRLVVAMAG